MHYRIQVPIEYPGYSDSLYFSIEEFEKLSEEEVEAMALERYERWRKAVADASSREAPEVTPEDLMFQKEELLDAIEAIEQQLAEMKADAGSVASDKA